MLAAKNQDFPVRHRFWVSLGLLLACATDPQHLAPTTCAKAGAHVSPDASPATQRRSWPSEPAPTYAEPARNIVLTYLGAAGWSVSDGNATLLVDPYVTRAALGDWDEVIQPDARAIERYIPEHAELIAVTHAHVDHVLDVPSIAWRTGAVVLGTQSTARLARAAGLPERDIISAHGGEDLRVGAFQVRVVPALHALTGQPYAAIPAGVRLPLRARDYQQGGTLQYFVRFAGHSLYFVGTANFVEAELHDMQPDVAIIAVGLRDKVPNYTCRLLRALGLPGRVLVNHFDEWTTALDAGRPLVSPEAEADLAAFEAEVHACAPGTRVEVPVHLQPITL